MTKNKAIIFIHKDKFEYYDESQSKIFQFVFQPTVFQDLELVDREELYTQLKTFISANKLTPAEILFVISGSVIFEKIFTITQASDKDTEIQKFLESIPFEHVSYKVVGTDKNFKVMAINKELYTSLQFCFESQGFRSLGIIPQAVLGGNYSTATMLNTDIIKYILTNFDTVQKQTFIQEEVKEPAPETTQQQNFNDPVNLAKPINKFRLPALISVFVLLMGVLSFVVYKQFTPPSKASPVPSTIVVPTVDSPSPAIIETPVSSTSAQPTQ
ncbi:hypothetical protein A2767_04595 [Candidatus Roizmanbacteria bacterium RIFCSPHIGHO2_01_FULL_35_10]|uniref:LytR/CpsA/Psr regulator C-terminal domain-containing protein n=1 Tax=Candidatus Roizmanbacteria bacterium RIFCSPLOWO2_01_FULL_35_13 TaxID=1802055 RepID=A0A1F7I7C0_9BACT|nr:MAG: hypothetical protein A2767_04595 [Candidatus Roizmanbacteria bacterium RIFCSPHIGHO2_01_FULL_35_10]OGK39172.1 MAG: hypothetical protein A3A74_03695 [Candidatus Roizmanbacteria bacterium RIFCSPLOWO2_01_FULL_35_13]